MSDRVKALILALIGAAVPILYTNWLAPALPDFPLDSAKVLELVLYAVGFLVGGWNLKQAAAGDGRSE